ncbi:hypothetical protein FA15DRAFT_390829 [Coprinopsis marcescibilis]|uniref:Nephrocystin 3-like N-terminal domain-containing protein n=1 Tax=Coprinopsis marcescibilis TaxID=230819 RepID=A0A5C3KXE9_COPMA|nr:hypothetical protein FA15DRAFT_390829 [Coprinopsis marcescibilis]
MGVNISTLFDTIQLYQKEGNAENALESVTINGGTVNAVGRDSIVHNNYMYYTIPVKPPLHEGDIRAIANWLTELNYKLIQQDTFRKRAPDTVKWILENPHVLKWLRNRGGAIWGTGMPGAGKTVLSSVVIDHLQELARLHEDIVVVFAYCRYSDAVSVRDILAAILRQLLERHPAVLDFVKPMYDYHKLDGTFPTEEELLSLLLEISRSNLFRLSFYVIDALDEAPRDTQIDVLTALRSLETNFFLTSRPLDSLKTLVPNAIFIDIAAQDGDIILLIDQKVKRTPALRRLLQNDEWRSKVVAEILEKSSGMFLLASLQLDMLRECLSIQDLREALDSLPSGVDDMYAATLERLDKQPRAELARRTLAWVSYAYRSLKIEELQRAVAVHPETHEYDSERLVDGESLVSLCCGLLVVDSRSMLVRLILQKLYRTNLPAK